MVTVLDMMGVNKRYREGWALREVTLCVTAGEIVALVGPNGAGKTTLLNLACGLLTPTEGRVAVFGGSPQDAARVLPDIGYVAQDHPLYRRFRVRELVEFGRRMNRRWDTDVVLGYLDAAGIPLSKQAGALSGGQQTTLALALALGKRPRLLLLDEPVASLDPVMRKAFLQTLRAAVAERELTILLSSHLIDAAASICDHLLLLVDGRLHLAGEIEALLAEHQLLVGPSDCVLDPSLTEPEIVARSVDGQEASLVIRSNAPVISPHFEPRPLSLETLVIAYMRAVSDLSNLSKIHRSPTTGSGGLGDVP